MARRLALIAHDNKKVDLVAWATFNRKTLAEFDLMATRHTARLVRDKVGLEAEELLPHASRWATAPRKRPEARPQLRSAISRIFMNAMMRRRFASGMVARSIWAIEEPNAS